MLQCSGYAGHGVVSLIACSGLNAIQWCITCRLGGLVRYSWIYEGSDDYGSSFMFSINSGLFFKLAINASKLYESNY